MLSHTSLNMVRWKRMVEGGETTISWTISDAVSRFGWYEGYSP